MGNFIVYKSSAGSGKTFTLVKEYLQICLSTDSQNKFKEILAITFTNKAAAEMKSRIIDALQNLSSKNGKATVLQNMLIDEIGISEDELKLRSQNLLSSILHNYADFSVSTIDKFTYKLVRVFARDLKIPINFEVELDQDNLLKKVIDLLIDQVGRDKEITQLLVDFTRSKTEDDKHWDVEKDIFEFAKDLLGEKGQFYLPGLRKLSINDFKSCRKEYVKLNKAYIETLSEIGQKALAFIHRNGIEDSLKRGIIDFFNYLKKSRLDKLKPTNTVQSAFENNSLYPQKLSQEFKTAIDQASAELTQFYNKAMHIIESEHPTYLARETAIKNLYSIALLNEIEKLFEKIKKEESIIHISDFNKRIAEVVNSEPIPFIYERLGEKYKHFMVDEFQDTSLLQYQNMMPLLENALSENNFNMLVGDAKQAIYRWRGGEVEQFSAMPQYIHPLQKNNTLLQERQTVLAQHYKELYLVENYRSSGKIVEFNNLFFSNLRNVFSERIQLIYKASEQGLQTKKEEGYVQVEFLTSEFQIYEFTSLQKVVESIHNCRNDGFPLKDIAVLCRSNSNASKVADHLIANDIEVISSESLLIQNSPNVNFLINVMKHILFPEDKSYQKPMVEFFVKEGQLGGELHENFQKWLNYKRFSDIFLEVDKDFNVEEFLKMPLYDMCEKVVRIFGFNKSYDLYIQFFLESVYNFYVRFGSGLPSFIEWWDDNADKLSLDVPESIDAVRIMTIHKAKGLEFPVVIYPFADYAVNNGKGNLWLHVNNRLEPSPPSMIIPCKNAMLESIYQEEMEEELDKKIMDMMNETYVAFTRAIDRLYVFAKELPKNVKEINSLHVMIDQGLQGFPEYAYLERIFKYGIPTISSNYTKNLDVQQKNIPKFISAAWENKLTISYEAPEEWSSSDVSGPRQYGNLIHKILSEINSEEDILQVINDFNFQGLLSEEETFNMQNELETLLNKKEIKIFFEKGLKIKKEEVILTPDGNSYRPDRVIYMDDSIKVVDFKSGAKNEAHQKQILNYMELVESIENIPVEGYLIYLGEKEVVLV